MRIFQRVLGAIGLLAICVLTSLPAQAQVFHVPRFYSTAGVHATGAAVPDGFITRMVPVDLNNVSAVAAARSAAADALNGLVTTGEIPAGQLVLYLIGFGDDPAHPTYPTFFVLDDDLLDNMSSADFDLAHGWLQPGDATSAQTYLHPFLTNAKPLVGGNPPPLKQYMIDFCEEWKDMQTNTGNPHYHANLPDPDGIVIAVESTLLAGGANCVSMLDYLAHSSHWTNDDVPGYPAGTSLADLYGAARGIYTSWPADIYDTVNGGIDIGSGATKFDDANRKFVIWYAQICETVRDAVLNNCCYSVASSYFPSIKITGNFADQGDDGENDATG